jgi:DNA-binding XRE family transcriptional regulator
MTEDNNNPKSGRPTRKYTNDLRLERLKRRLSRKEVGRLIGRSLATVRRYERGHIAPPLITALKLQILFRAQLASIYQGLYAQLTPEMRTAEERLVTPRRKRGVA